MIYTDVPAVFTADPRLVSQARELEMVTFEKMMEVASLGLNVLHIRCMEIAAKFQVKIHVPSSFEHRKETWIMDAPQNIERPVVTAVTHNINCATVRAFNLPPRVKTSNQVFASLSARGIVVDVISQWEYHGSQSLAFSVTQENLHSAFDLIKNQSP